MILTNKNIIAIRLITILILLSHYIHIILCLSYRHLRFRYFLKIVYDTQRLIFINQASDVLLLRG